MLRASSKRSSTSRWSAVTSSSTLWCVATDRRCWGGRGRPPALNASGSAGCAARGMRRRRTVAAGALASSTRWSMSFIVRASRTISSSPSGTGTRRCSSVPPMAATSARICSTGRRVRPTRSQINAASTPAASGTAIDNDVISVVTLSSMSSVDAARYTMTSPSGVSTIRLSSRTSPSMPGNGFTVADRLAGSDRVPDRR